MRLTDWNKLIRIFPGEPNELLLDYILRINLTEEDYFGG